MQHMRPLINHRTSNTFPAQSRVSYYKNTHNVYFRRVV